MNKTQQENEGSQHDSTWLDKLKSCPVTSNIKEAVLVTDLQGTVLFANPQIVNITGYSHKEILGKKAYRVFLPQRVWAAFEKRIEKREQGISENYEMVHHKRDGSKCWVSVSASPFRNEVGEIIGTIGILRDISERIKKDQAILEGKNILKKVLNTSLDAIFTVDLLGNIVDCNSHAHSMLGYEAGSLSETSFFNLLNCFQELPLREEALEILLGIAEQTHRGKYLETEVTCKHGEKLFVELCISPIRRTQGYLFAVFMRDISQQKAQEKLILDAKEAAERAHNAERQFLTHMSHEIRTPMNAVIGMIDLLKETTLSSEQEEYIEALAFSAENMMNVISGILDFSKIEAGELELDKSAFSLQALLSSLQKTYQFKVKNKNISIDLYIDNQIQTQLIGDHVRINQVLSNLLGNASKFTKEGVIGINAQVDRKEGDIYWVSLEVYDTGIGIAPENIKKIFEQFKQAEYNTHAEFGGTGLGLSIVKQLVEMHGGSIDIESTLGKGTTFKVLLPLEDAKIPVSKDFCIKESTSKDQDLEHVRVLIAEDNLLNKKLIHKIMQNWQCNYTIVDNGKQALDWTYKERFDLIFMDINMPVLDGYQSTKYIRSDHENPNQHTPIIALTAAAFQEERNRMLELGATDFVTKPFSLKKLKQIMLRILDDFGKSSASNSSTQEPLYDLKVLEQYGAHDQSFVSEVLSIFLKKTPKSLTEMEQSLDRQDWHQLRYIAHQLKSTYGTLGMLKEQDITEVIEYAIDEGKRNYSFYHQRILALQKQSQAIYPLFEKKVNQLRSA